MARTGVICTSGVRGPPGDGSFWDQTGPGRSSIEIVPSQTLDELPVASLGERTDHLHQELRQSVSTRWTRGVGAPSMQRRQHPTVAATERGRTTSDLSDRTDLMTSPIDLRSAVVCARECYSCTAAGRSGTVCIVLCERDELCRSAAVSCHAPMCARPAK